ncbi:hypothetical protein EBT31_03985 [bacterium]|nr:hypothetical protein [bacterium]
MTKYVNCPLCKGTGKYYRGRICKWCAGSGLYASEYGGRKYSAAERAYELALRDGYADMRGFARIPLPEDNGYTIILRGPNKKTIHVGPWTRYGQFTAMRHVRSSKSTWSVAVNMHVNGLGKDNEVRFWAGKVWERLVCEESRSGADNSFKHNVAELQRCLRLLAHLLPEDMALAGGDAHYNIDARGIYAPSAAAVFLIGLWCDWRLIEDARAAGAEVVPQRETRWRARQSVEANMTFDDARALLFIIWILKTVKEWR